MDKETIKKDLTKAIAHIARLNNVSVFDVESVIVDSYLKEYFESNQEDPYGSD